MLRRFWCMLLLLVTTIRVSAAVDRFPWKDGERIVFLGDSITHAGTYVQYVDAYLRTRFPERQIELINLGLSSETVTGLSEPDHPYPRPDLHERIDRVLAQARPNVVVLCYGMNDGIYYPFAEERFAKFRASIREMVDRIRRSGAQVILMTPPPFDPGTIASHLVPAGAPKYSYAAPYADYDATLARYAAWEMTLRSRSQTVVELHKATWDFMAAVHKDLPGYHLAADGIHPNASGHAIIARQLLLALHAPPEADIAEIDARSEQITNPRITDLLITPEEIRFHWLSNLPMPIDPQWDEALRKHGDLAQTLNRYRLVLHHAPDAHYKIFEGDTLLGETTRIELERGLDLLRLPDLSTNRRSLEILKLIQQRERLMSAAWLTAVGHKRPEVPAGLPLAEARRQASLIEEQLHRLCQPMNLILRLVPAR